MTDEEIFNLMAEHAPGSFSLVINERWIRGFVRAAIKRGGEESYDKTKYKLVPIIPTEDMTHAAAWIENIDFINGQLSWGSAERIYNAMIKAVPTV